MTSKIDQIVGWVKMQKPGYPENGKLSFYEIKKFLVLISYDTFYDFQKLSFCGGGNL